MELLNGVEVIHESAHGVGKIGSKMEKILFRLIPVFQVQHLQKLGFLETTSRVFLSE